MKLTTAWSCLAIALVACGGSSEGGKRLKDRPDGELDAGTDASSGSTPTGCAVLNCDPNATCDKSSGTAKCACDAGYDGDGKTCTDVDECATDNGGCDANADCVNSDGGFTCKCKPGEVCADVDECANAAMNDCADNATCVNDPAGAYDCTCAGDFAGDDPESCYCDLSGYWAMRLDVDTCWCNRDLVDTTIVSAGSVEATVWELHKLSYDGKSIIVEKKGCGSDNTPDLISPFFSGETYSSYLPDELFDRLDVVPGKEIPEPGLAPGSTYTTPEEAAVVGIDLGPDPETAAWPTAGDVVNPIGGDAPAWADSDDDGEPALTVWPRLPKDRTDDSKPGAGNTHFYSYLPLNFDAPTGKVTERAGCVSLATRVITKQNAEIDTCERITGDVINVRTDGRVEGCTTVPKSAWGDDVACAKADWTSAVPCAADAVKRLDDQDQTQQTTATFELVKIGELDGDFGCADVRTKLPAIKRATPTPASCNCQ